MICAGLAAGCTTQHAARPPPAQAPAVLAEVPASAPPTPAPALGSWRSAWTRACVATTSRVRPCELSAAAADDAGNVYVGGGSYMAFELAGEKHPARGFEQMVLASFDANGAPRWSHAFGSQWHNLVHDVRVIGDRLFVVGTHANGFDAGGVRLPNIPPPKVPGQDTGFESETGFVAAYDLDGKALWAKNLSRLLDDSNRPGVHAGGSMFGCSIHADGGNGAWLTIRDAQTHVVHVTADGAARESYVVDLTTPGILLGRVTSVDAKGELFRLWKSKDGTPRLRRCAANSPCRDTALPLMPASYPQWGALRVLDSGGVVAVVTGDQIIAGGYRFEIQVVALDAAGRVTLSRPLMEPGFATQQTQVLGVSTTSDGGWLLAVRHATPLMVDGAVVPAAAEGTTSLFELSADARRTLRVWQLDGAACPGFQAKTLSFFPSTPGHLLAVGDAPTRSAALLCGDSRVMGGVVTSLSLVGL